VHPENRHYGHAGILATSAYGSGSVPVIRGQIQHGWSFGHGLGARARQVAGLRRLGWGDRTLEQGRLVGVPRLTAIGAPFAYLARATGVGPETPKPAGTVVYPYHSTEKLGITGSHLRLADEIAEREAGRRVTVVLYFADHTPETVRTYEAKGFTVTSHGHRSDLGFLDHQLAVLAGHDRVVTNRVGTALWYGAHLGLEAEIYGPYFGDELVASIDAHLERRQRDLWPELHHGGVRGSDAVDLGDEELGIPYLRSSEELRDLLGPPIDTLGRRARLRAARMEYQTRRVLVRGLGSIPLFAAVDAVPMPKDLADRQPVTVP
jgi:hypothetical protein